MSKIKQEYSMNEAESSYFALSWISANIKYNCSSRETGFGSKDPTILYNEGIGGSNGFVELFNTIC